MLKQLLNCNVFNHFSEVFNIQIFYIQKFKVVKSGFYIRKEVIHKYIFILYALFYILILYMLFYICYFIYVILYAL